MYWEYRESSWFHLQDYIEMHGQQNVKFTVDSSDNETWDGVRHILESNNLKYFVTLAFMQLTNYKKIHPEQAQRLW
jgi:hypothetical protein